MARHTLNPDALRLEESFFSEENAKLLEKLREEAREKERREALRTALHIDDEGVIDALVELDLYPETAIAFGLVPMITVAWADFEIQANEREAVLKAAAERGIETGSTTYQLLENWLSRKPGPELLATWKHYIGVVAGNMNEHDRASFRDQVMAKARGVAEAAGGFLGVGPKVSAAEKKVLDELSAAFG